VALRAQLQLRNLRELGHVSSTARAARPPSLALVHALEDALARGAGSGVIREPVPLRNLERLAAQTSEPAVDGALHTRADLRDGIL
jgi:hypothetical protein